MLLSSSRDMTLRLWCPIEEKCLATLSGHKDAVTSCDMAIDGLRLVSGDSSGLLKFWDLGNGKNYLSLEAHRGPVELCKFNSEGSLILTLGGFEAKLFNIDGSEVGSIASEMGNGPRHVGAWSPVAPLIAFGTRTGEVIVIALKGDKLREKSDGGRIRTKAHQGELRALAFLTTGGLVTGGDDCILKIWQVCCGDDGLVVMSCVKEMRNLHSSPLLTISSSSSEDIISTTSEAITEILMWDLRDYEGKTGSELILCRIEPGVSQNGTCHAPTIDKPRILASVGADGRVLLFDIEAAAGTKRHDLHTRKERFKAAIEMKKGGKVQQRENNNAPEGQRPEGLDLKLDLSPDELQKRMDRRKDVYANTSFQQAERKMRRHDSLAKIFARLDGESEGSIAPSALLLLGKKASENALVTRQKNGYDSEKAIVWTQAQTLALLDKFMGEGRVEGPIPNRERRVSKEVFLTLFDEALPSEEVAFDAIIEQFMDANPKKVMKESSESEFSMSNVTTTSVSRMVLRNVPPIAPSRKIESVNDDPESQKEKRLERYAKYAVNAGGKVMQQLSDAQSERRGLKSPEPRFPSGRDDLVDGGGEREVQRELMRMKLAMQSQGPTSAQMKLSRERAERSRSTQKYRPTVQRPQTASAVGRGGNLGCQHQRDNRGWTRKDVGDGEISPLAALYLMRN